MQYEGYDNKKKHLFTFIVPEVDEDGKRLVSMRTDSAISGFSGDDELSKLEQTAYGGESMMDVTERMTDYDVCERLLSF